MAVAIRRWLNYVGWRRFCGSLCQRSTDHRPGFQPLWYPGPVLHLGRLRLDIKITCTTNKKLGADCIEIHTGKFANLVKEFGFGNRKIIWQPSDLFNLDEYMDAHWFPEQLEMYHLEYKEMQEAKDLYCERSISFLDYFFKRLDIYRACEMPTFIKYYRGVDIEKYKDKIRKITDDYPYQNERGDLI